MLTKFIALVLIIAAFRGAECAEEPVNMFSKILGLVNPVQEHMLEKRQANFGTCTLQDFVDFTGTLSPSCAMELADIGNQLSASATIPNFTEAAVIRIIADAFCGGSCVNEVAQFYDMCNLSGFREALAVVCSTNENGVQCYNILPIFNTLRPTIFTSCPTQSQIQQLENLGCCGNFIALDVISVMAGQDFEQRYSECGYDAPSQRCAVTTVNSTAALQISYMVIALLMMATALMNF